MNKEYVKEVLGLIDKSPTAFHVIENAKFILDQNGFEGLRENEIWKLKAGGRYYVTRNDSSLIAFTIPEKDYKGYRIIASHSDSPCPKLKEDLEVHSNSYVRLDVEKYGGMLLAPWFDRPLSVAGRVIVRDDSSDTGIRSVLVNVDKDVAVIPSLAIHMNKEANSGYSYSFQKDMLPIVSTFKGTDKGDLDKGVAEENRSLLSIVADEAGVEPDSIIGNDLFMYIREKGRIWGVRDEFVGASRLDDQECVWCTLYGFVDAVNSDRTKTAKSINHVAASGADVSGAVASASEYINMLCIFDNEEVGSRTKQGADSDFLENLISRLNDNLGRSREQYYTAYANSFMISADNAHALHPAHTDKYDPVQSPKVNEGIVIKFSARQSYTTDAVSGAFVRKICEDNDISYQVFVNHSDEPGGSTLGNISNSHVSVNTADIGLAQLAMHSAYETAGVEDIQSMREFAKAFYNQC